MWADYLSFSVLNVDKYEIQQEGSKNIIQNNSYGTNKNTTHVYKMPVLQNANYRHRSHAFTKYRGNVWSGLSFRKDTKMGHSVTRQSNRFLLQSCHIICCCTYLMLISKQRRFDDFCVIYCPGNLSNRPPRGNISQKVWLSTLIIVFALVVRFGVIE